MEDVAMGMEDEMPSKKPQKINNIDNENIIELLNNHIISEMKRIQKHIADDNNKLSKTKPIENEDVSKDVSPGKSIPSLTREPFDIFQYGKYRFDVQTDCIQTVIYSFGKRMTHHFLFEENGQLTKIGDLHRKTLSDILFYNLPEDIKKEYIRKDKIENLI